MNKPIKPEITIPQSFAENGIKIDFDNKLLTDGFNDLEPDVLAGDNLNKFIDDTYKGLNYGIAAGDAINLISEGETLTVKDGQLVSGSIGTGINDKITNCITEIPQRIKLELKDGTLTLKKGSVVTVPNGSGVFDEITISADKTRTWTYTRQGMMFYRYDTNVLYPVPSSQIHSGTTAPTGTLPSPTCWYDTTNNKVKITSDGGTTWIDTFSLPLCLLTANGTQITSIDQVFNGFGYIGSTVWADKGVVNLIANGRNDVGSLINQERTIPRIVTHTIPSAWGKKSMEVVLNYNAGEVPNLEALPTYRFTKNGVVNTKDTWTWTYYENDNKWFYSGNSGATWTQVIAGFLGTLEFDGTKVTEFNPKQPFRAVDYNEAVLKNSLVDISELGDELAYYGMPDYTKGVARSAATIYQASTNVCVHYTGNSNSVNSQPYVGKNSDNMVQIGDVSGNVATNSIVTFFVPQGWYYKVNGSGISHYKEYPLIGG